MAMANSPYLMSSIVENMSDMFIAVSSDWEIQYMNQSAKSFVESIRPHFRPGNAFDVLPEINGTDLGHFLAKVMDRRQAETREFFVPQLGQWIEVKAVPHEDGGMGVFYLAITQRKNTEKQLMDAAYHDHLTTLPNRRSIFQLVEQFLETETPFSLLFLDIDGFHFVNDAYGQMEGDKLLRDTALLLNDTLANSTFGRVGGDEFVLLLNETDSDQLELAIEALFDAFNRSPVSKAMNSFQLGISLGVARFPQDAATVDTLLRFAELAMYDAKKKVRNSYAFFNQDMDLRMQREQQLLREISRNFDQTSIRFVVQPQFDTSTEEMCGIEVLSRWKHEEFGDIKPSEIIALIEKSGRMEQFTLFQVEFMLGRLRSWKENYNFSLRMAINVTPSLLSNFHFFQHIENLFRQYEISLDTLEIEITENMTLSSSKLILQNILYFRSKGVQITLDDFGTGYSKLADLIDFPIDKIKIDRFFIDKIGKAPNTESLLQTFLNLSEGLSCSLLAEGVEYEYQHDYLKALEIHHVQGFYYSRPLALEDFEAKYVK